MTPLPAAACSGLLALAIGPTAAVDDVARLAPGAALGTPARFGVNLGGRTAWGAEQLMTNVLRNPGLEAVLDGALVVAGQVSARGIVDDTAWTARPAGFWTGARLEVLSGAAAGARGRAADDRRAAPERPIEFVLERW